MKSRIHIVVDEVEKERFRQRAEREGKSLSSWLRDAAREKLEVEPDRLELDTEVKLRAFFAGCDALQEGQGREPEWEEHLQVIEASRRSGVTDT
ncbi:MAG: antitoxin [Vicinamibacteria bacterium]